MGCIATWKAGRVLLRMQPCRKQYRLIEHGRVEYISLYAFGCFDIYQWRNMIPPVDTAATPFFALHAKLVRTRICEAEYFVCSVIVFSVEYPAHFVCAGIAAIFAVLERDAIINGIRAG